MTVFEQAEIILNGIEVIGDEIARLMEVVPATPADADRLKQELGAPFTPLVFDVTDEAGWKAAVDKTVSTFGGLDVLVNNAGINRRGPLLELTPDDWHMTMRVNVDAMFYLCREAIPHMIEQGGGAIVNTASQWGLHPAPGHIAYNVSKSRPATAS